MAGVITSVFSGIKAFAASSWIGKALVNLGASLLLSAASKALMPKPEQSIGSRTVTTRNPVTPRDLVYGRVRKGGAVVFIDEVGDRDVYLDMVIVLAGHRVEKIGAIYFDGEEACADGANTMSGRWSGSVYRALGDDDQAAIVQNNQTTWTASHRLRGCAHIYVRIAFNPDDPQSIPNVTADIWGKNDIYDPRDGSTGYTTNAALCVADYMAWSRARGGCGIPYGGTTGIDTDDLSEAANVCDESVATAAGGTESRYTCNGVVTLNQTRKTIIQALLTSLAGWVSDTPPYRIRAGAHRTSDASFGLDDIVGSMSVQTRIDMAENCNGVRGQFVSPDNSWVADDFPAYQSAVYLAEDDDEERWFDMNLPFTSSADTAQRLARIHLEQVRRQITVNLTGHAGWLAVEPGDTVDLTISRYGWSSKLFRVDRMAPRIEDNQILIDVTLRETAAGVWSWDATEAEIYASAPATNLPAPWSAPAAGYIDVTEALYTTRDGGGVKALARLSWEAASSAYVAQYRVRAKPPGGDWRDVVTTRTTTADVLDVQPGTWEFEVRGVATSGVVSPATTRTVEIVGLSAPPAALTGVSLQSAGGLAVIRWNTAAELDVRQGGRIAIRHSAAASGATWTSSRAIDAVPGNAALAVLPLMPGSYLLRAEDSTGNAGPVSTVSADGAQAVTFAAIDTMQEDDEFTGSGAGVTTVGGARGLVIEDTTDFDTVADTDALASWDWPSGSVAASATYVFSAGLDLLTSKRARLRSTIAIDALAPLDDFDSRPGEVDSWSDWDGTDGAEVDCFIEVRTTPDDPSGSPPWSDWFRLDAGEIQARGIEARAQLSTTDSAFTPFVSQLRVQADEVA